MRVLFIGGTGLISSGCAPLCLERGDRLVLLNRGQSVRPIPAGAEHIPADIRDAAAVRTALGRRTFDVVVNWIGYAPAHIETDLQLFRGKTGQYVFISSASAYQTPPARLPVTEETPRDNPFWEYSRQKIACETRLMRAFREDGFPVTIVRPSHTYDRTSIPLKGGYTSLHRMLQGKPVLIHGDGTSLWTLTHHRDFSRGFVGLLGNPAAIGEAFHITSDEWLTWNQIAQLLGEAAGVPPRIAHVTSDFIAKMAPQWAGSLLGDKSHSMIFDNRKIKQFVPDFAATIPFREGAREMIDWHLADPARQVTDPEVDATIERILARYPV